MIFHCSRILNPFNPSTNRFDLPEEGHVEFGFQHARTKGRDSESGRMTTGYMLSFGMVNDNGSSSTGMYFYSSRLISFKL